MERTRVITGGVDGGTNKQTLSMVTDAGARERNGQVDIRGLRGKDLVERMGKIQ